MSEHTTATATTEGNGRRKPKSFSELFPGRFLHADHITGSERAVKNADGDKLAVLQIADVYVEELAGGEKGKQLKAIVAFAQTPLLLIIPKLNGTCMRAMFGPNVQDWIGKRVALFVTDKFAPMNGEPCIRVWGSPDLAKDVSVEYAMPKRRNPIRMTMHAMPNAHAKSDG